MSEASNASAAGGAEARRDDHVQVARGAGLTGIGAVIEGVLRYGSMLLVTRGYGASAYGVFTFVMLMTEAGQRVSSAGLYDGVMRDVAVHKAQGNDDRVRGAIRFAGKIMLVVGVLMTIGLWFTADWVASDVFEPKKDTDVPRDVVAAVVRIACFALPAMALLMLFGRTLRALKNIGAQVILRSILLPVSRVGLIVGFLLVLGRERVDGLAWAVLLSFAGCAALGAWFVHRETGLLARDRPGVVDKREFMRFALPLVGVDIVVFFSLNLDFLLLGMLHGQAETGIYGAAKRLTPILGLPLMMFTSLLTPMSAQYYGEGRLDELRALYRTSVRWIFAVALPFVIAGVIWAVPILAHLGDDPTDDFGAGAPAFMLLAVTLVLTGFANPAGYAVTMAGRSKLTLFNAVVCLLVIGGLGRWLIPEHGMMGAAIAYAGSLLANSLLTLTQGWWILGLNPVHAALWKPATAGLAAAAAGWLLHEQAGLAGSLGAALLGGMAVAAVYVVALIVFGLDQEDKDVLAAGSKPLHGVLRRLGIGGRG